MIRHEIGLRSGWINMDKLLQYLTERNIEELCKGPRDNRTDGEWQRIFHQIDVGALFISHGNVYDALSFIPTVDWADQYSYLIKKT